MANAVACALELLTSLRLLLVPLGQRRLPPAPHGVDAAAADGDHSRANHDGQKGVEEAVDDGRGDLELAESGEATYAQNGDRGTEPQRPAVTEAAQGRLDDLLDAAAMAAATTTMTMAAKTLGR